MRKLELKKTFDEVLITIVNTPEVSNAERCLLSLLENMALK